MRPAHRARVSVVLRAILLLGILPSCFAQQGPDPLSDEGRREMQRKEDERKQDARIKRAFRQSEAAESKARKAQVAADEATARLEEVEAKLSAQEREKEQAAETARRNNEATPLRSYHGVIARRLADGGVSASINGSIVRFDSAAAFNRHIVETEKADQERAAQAARAREDYDRGVVAARDRIFKKYPVFADENTLERLALDAYVTRLIDNPENKAFFQDPNWPEKAAEQFAAVYKIGPSGRK